MGGVAARQGWCKNMVTGSDWKKPLSETFNKMQNFRKVGFHSLPYVNLETPQKAPHQLLAVAEEHYDLRNPPAPNLAELFHVLNSIISAVSRALLWMAVHWAQQQRRYSWLGKAADWSGNAFLFLLWHDSFHPCGFPKMYLRWELSQWQLKWRCNETVLHMSHSEQEFPEKLCLQRTYFETQLKRSVPC